MITLALLSSICTESKSPQLERWVEPLTEACQRYSILTPESMAMFLAQLAHESGRFRLVHEIWGPTETQVRYEGRKDLGNTEPGDGFRFRGRGLIQITGRNNYADASFALFGDKQVLLDRPERLEEPKYAALSAAWFWKSRRLGRFADTLNLEACTRAINGGLNGFADRQTLYTRACQALGVFSPKEAP